MIDRRLATEYLAVPLISFWKWQDHGQVVTWVDGETIAFQAELKSILGHLATQGLPPLGAVLLVLSACRATERPGLDSIHGRTLRRVLAELGAEDLATVLPDALQSMAVIHHVWQRLQSQQQIKASIAASVFACFSSFPKFPDAGVLLELLDAGPVVDEVPVIPNGPRLRRQLVYELGLLRRSLGGIKTEEFELRVRTGLDQFPLDAPLEPLPPAGNTRDLLRSIADDQELSGLARLARHVLATLNLPRALSDPDDLPEGGLSDLTNRGSLDRLLISELAHDELTLAVRIALREALYLRRESPPRTPHRRRTILIDAGLRMWGQPRLFAASVGLAIAAASEASFELDVFRSAGARPVPVDFRTRAGLIEHLKALDHTVHPAAALCELGDGRGVSEEQQEIVLITEDDVAEDDEFRLAIAQCELPPLFIVALNREGRYRLFARNKAGSRLLREANFSLDEILSPPTKRTRRVVEKSSFDHTPDINRVTPFPLYLSAQVDNERTWFVPKVGVVSLPKDGRLLLWSDAKRGAQQLAEGMPGGVVHWCGEIHERQFAVVGRLQQGDLHLLEFDLSTGVSQHTPLRLKYDRPLGVAGHAGVVFVIYALYCEAFDIDSGQSLGTVPIPRGLNWKRGRFFQQLPSPGKYTKWYAIDANLKFVEVCQEQQAFGPILTLIEAGDAGPVAISGSGLALYLGTGALWKFNKEPSCRGRELAVSHHHPSFIYWNHDAKNQALSRTFVDLQTQECRPYQGPMNIVQDPSQANFLGRPRQLRHKFQSITVNGLRQLTLISRNGNRWPLQLSANRRAILLPDQPEPNAGLQSTTITISSTGVQTTAAELDKPLIFERDPEGSGHYDLRYARWPDGSLAVLDSRGLLHLRSSDASLPSLTIVLNPGETAGWVADGRMWGPTYFIGDHAATPAQVIADELLKPFVERLP